MELEQEIRKRLNLMIYEATGASYIPQTRTHIQKVVGQIYKTYHGTRFIHS